MRFFSSKLFKRQGYISLQEYVEDIRTAETTDSWRLPLGLGDRLQIFFLSIIVKLSWFADVLFVRHSFSWSPAYSILIKFLEKKGVIDTVQEQATFQSGYFLYRFQKSIVIGGMQYSFHGQGIGRDRAAAFSKGLGKIIEQMVSGVLDENKNIVRASPREMVIQKHKIVYLPRYHHFLPVQRERYRELRHDATHPLEWVWGENMVTKRKTAIPQQMTSWFKYQYNFQEVLTHPTSSGSAGYFTPEGAILRGIFEVVKRDAFLVHWLTQIAPRVIIRHTLPESIQSALREFEMRGITLFVLETTALMIPSVCIVAINEQGESPRIILSNAAGINFEQAVHQAVLEMRMNSMDFFQKNELAEKRLLDEVEAFVSALDQKSRSRYYCGKERVDQFRWFICGERVGYEEVCRYDQACLDDDTCLQACLGTLEKQGSGYYPVVYFPKNKLQNKIGFSVVQVFIPKAFPLYWIEYMGTFESDRLHEFANTKQAIEWKINPFPHMFM